ncbi:hypothetical protein BGZ96_000442 [Linnemannia gamsii]|uniref:Zincin n=1 Tax=Linnemannia gamsii TaxID=64522 RepID=A0ABQ7KBF8_9FUNG|nr:hypothetical protein BGZ96_000442 [Linnemannia gamsii]
MVSKKLISFAAIGAALSMVAAAPVIHVGENRSSLLNQDVCTSSDCAATAAQILKDMNANADPCEDFSEFSCGGFYQNTVLSDAIPSTEHLSDLRPKVTAIVRDLADPSRGNAPQAAPGDTAAESNLKKLHDMYASCMDVTTAQRAGRQPLVNQLKSVLSLLPKSITVDKAALSKVIARLTKLGIPTFYTFTTGPNIYDPNLNLLTGVQGGLTFPAAGYNQSPELAELESTIAVRFQTFMAAEDIYANRTEPITVADVQQEWVDAAKDVIAFETLLADATVKNPEESKGPKGLFYNLHSFDNLSAMAPSIDWSLLLSELIPAEVEYTRPLNLQAPAFLPALETIINSTSTKTLHNYFAWRIIVSQSSLLQAPYNPSPKTEELWMVCSNLVANQLADITGHYYVERVLPDSSQAVFRTMIKEVVTAYGEGFPTLSWLDQPTLDGALKKLHAIKEVIGQSAESPNGASSESVEEYYRGLTIDASDFYANMEQKSIWEFEKEIAGINQPVPKDQMSNSPPTEVNASYSPLTNRVYFYAGMIQSPWFHASNPEYVNYAGMGSVAGHEIGHGFDDSGKDFDYSGNYTSWWTHQTATAFTEKSQCFIEQYGNFTVKGPDNLYHNLDGEKTLGENIADNGGVKYAFRAWQKRFQSDTKGREYKNFKLPGLENYTPEQMFFLSVGHAWCSKSTPKVLVADITGDEHANGKFRILGPLQNSPEFSQAFKCAPKTRMNPDKKCSLW